MADKENSVRLTGAAKKRAEEEHILHHDAMQSAVKNRVVLGERSNILNPPKHPSSTTEPPRKLKCRSRKESDPDVPDVDSNADNTQMSAPYASDIFNYLRSMEVESKRRPLPKYIEDVQTDINPSMRAVLVDWLVEVAEEYTLVSDTLYLTVAYIDRYLSHCCIKRHRLQLLGVSCMLIASKYEEIIAPHVEEFCYITDNTYTREEVQEMESDVLSFLQFEMKNPTIKSFLRRFVQVAEESPKLVNFEFEIMCDYLAELSLLDYGCIQYLPSMVAAAVIFVSRFTIYPELHPWNVKLQYCTGYTPLQLKQCVHIIHELQHGKRACNLMAIRDKYKLEFAATLLSPIHIPESYFEDIKL